MGSVTAGMLLLYFLNFLSVHAASVVEINTRFSTGTISANTLEDAGVLLHQGFGHDEEWIPWRAGPHSDRVSTLVTSANLAEKAGKRLNIFSTAAGFVLSPSKVEMLCSYPSDGGTYDRTCDPHGAVKPGCIPGCECVDTLPRPCNNWCSKSRPSRWGDCAYPPQQLENMLERFADEVQTSEGTSYNEVVVSTSTWPVPDVIDAVFYIQEAGFFSRGCEDTCGDSCERAKKVYSALLQNFSLTVTQVPLLCMDPSNITKPFTDHSQDLALDGRLSQKIFESTTVL